MPVRSNQAVNNTSNELARLLFCEGHGVALVKFKLATPHGHPEYHGCSAESGISVDYILLYIVNFLFRVLLVPSSSTIPSYAGRSNYHTSTESLHANKLL